LDNATVHNDAAARLPPGWQLLPQAAHSPDCNKPIEHVHGQLDHSMKVWLVDERQVHGNVNPTPDDCKAQLTQFFNSITVSSLAADIDTLPETWQEIVNVGGCYTAGRFA
jgi:hypothetical protein